MHEEFNSMERYIMSALDRDKKMSVLGMNI